MKLLAVLVWLVSVYALSRWADGLHEREFTGARQVGAFLYWLYLLVGSCAIIWLLTSK